MHCTGPKGVASRQWVFKNAFSNAPLLPLEFWNSRIWMQTDSGSYSAAAICEMKTLLFFDH